MQVEVEVKVEVDVDPVISGTRSSGCGVSGGKRDRPKCVRDQVVLMKSRLIHGQVLVHTREEVYHLCPHRNTDHDDPLSNHTTNERIISFHHPFHDPQD
jgi:hypothetical protein